MSRDFAAELRALIDAEVSDGDAAPLVAERIVAKLRATDPELLAGWLDANAVSFIREAIGRIDRSGRSRARALSGRSVFGDAAAAAEGGDPSRLGHWLETRFVVNEDRERLPLARMKAEHLRFVAKEYDADAKAARFEAAFMRALAKRVGAGCVEDVFTDEQIAELRRSIGGRAAA